MPGPTIADAVVPGLYRLDHTLHVDVAALAVLTGLIALALVLASPAARYVTGHILYVDGGVTAML